MRQGGGGLHLALEAKKTLCITGSIDSNELYCAWPPEEEMFGEVDLAHPADTKQAFQLVLSQFAGLERLLTQGVDAMRAVDGQCTRE